MEIGIIGAGQIGGTLTRLLTERGHTVRVSNSRAPETLADLAAETGAAAFWAAEAPGRRGSGDRQDGTPESVWVGTAVLPHNRDVHAEIGRLRLRGRPEHPQPDRRPGRSRRAVPTPVAGAVR
jgi:hypothetical protein